MAKRENVFSVAEWAPLHEAFARAEAALGSHPHAWLDVRAHLLGGRLRSAVRRKVGHELLLEQLEPVFWENYLWTHPDSEPDDKEGYSEWFLVSRRDLDRLYAVAAPTDDEAVRAKPGRKFTDDWPTWVARWLILKATDYPGELANVEALVREVRDFLENKEIFIPQDDKQVRRVIKDLLQFVQRESTPKAP